MKAILFINIIAFLSFLGTPSLSFAGNCATELVFQSGPVSSTAPAKKSKRSFKEKLATWAWNRYLKKANKEKGRNAYQELQEDEFKKKADKAVGFGALSIFLPFFSIIAIVSIIPIIVQFNKDKAIRKYKTAAWFGLILSILGLGITILVAPYVLYLLAYL